MQALLQPPQPRAGCSTLANVQHIPPRSHASLRQLRDRLTRQPYFFFFVAVGSVSAAVLVRYVLNWCVSEEAPFLPFILAVLVAAWCGGMRPGLLATVLSAAIGGHLFIDPSNPSWFRDATKPLWFVVFLSIGVTVSWLCESLHAARRRAEEVTAKVISQQKALEQEAKARWQSDERFRRAILESPFPVMLHAENGEVVALSQAWTELTGYTPNQLRTTADWTRLAYNGNRLKVDADIERLYELDQRMDEGEYVIKTSSGQQRVWDFSSAPLGRLADGRRLVISMAKDVTLRKQTEGELLTLTTAVEAAANGIVITDRKGVILWVNPAFSKLTGYSKEEAVGQMPTLMKSGRHSDEFYHDLWQVILSGSVWRGHITNRRKDGTLCEEEMTITPVRNTEGAVTHFIAIKESVQERKLLEEQLRQSQKMEAIGRLAGGVAHDFNNLLTIISGYSEILLMTLPVADPNRTSVKAISEAGQRAAGLTRQLLSFSRQAVLEPEVLDLNSVVAESEKMLRRMIGEDILLTTVLDPQVRPVKIDPGQIVQVLMNLAVNARDAMPQGGKLTIETANVDLDEMAVANQPGCTPGPHVQLIMTDTGCGMTEEVKARIFEPFYTTKEVGKGTGLGLAVVQGIVQQSGGFIAVDSEPGVGTAFWLYLPVVNEKVAGKKGEIDPTTVRRGTETVLLVEDDDSVREIALLALRRHGYKVITGANGKEALRAIEKHAGIIDLLVTDVVMPEMSGRQLAETLQPRFPQMQVVYMSGYTDDAVVRHGVLQAEVAFVHKPYTPLVLLKKVRQVLDEKKP